MFRNGMATMVLALGASVVFAQAQPGQPRAGQDRDREARIGAQDQKVCLASELIGMQVKDSSGQQVGTVKDFVVAQQGQVKYLAVQASAAGAAATPARPAAPDRPAAERPAVGAAAGGELVLVPFSKVNTRAPEAEGSAKAITLTIAKAELEKAPKFSVAQISDKENTEWMAEVDRHFGAAGASARPNLEDREGSARPRERTPDRAPERDNEADN